MLYRVHPGILNLSVILIPGVDRKTLVGVEAANGLLFFLVSLVLWTKYHSNLALHQLVRGRLHFFKHL